jgi:uncharacterized protein (TIRG00374 family)
MGGSAKSCIKVVLAAAILAIIAYKLDFREILHTLLSINPYAVIAAIVIALTQPLFAAARLSAVVALYARQLPFGNSLRTTFEGMFFGQTFVSFLGGDALRIWRIRGYDLPLREAVSVVAFDRLLGIIVNHIVMLASLPWLLMHITNHLVRVGLIGLAVAGIGGIVAAILLAVVPGRLGLFRRLPEAVRSHRIVQSLLYTSSIGRHLLQPNRELVGASLMSLLIALSNSAIFFVLLTGWGVELPLAIACAMIVPAVLEIAMLPISVAGWGIREGTTIVAFGALGVSADIAFNSSVVFALVTLAVSLIGGALWLIDRREIEAIAAQSETEASLALLTGDERAS